MSTNCTRCLKTVSEFFVLRDAETGEDFDYCRRCWTYQIENPQPQEQDSVIRDAQRISDQIKREESP